MKLKQQYNEPVTNPTTTLHHLLSLKDIQFAEYIPDHGTHIVTVIHDLTFELRQCPDCKTLGQRHGWRSIDLIDLPCMGRPLVIRWRKQRLRCTNPDCATTWTIQDARIASKRCRTTTRAAKWCVEQIIHGRTIAEIARELGCDWHTVDRAIQLYGTALLEADTKRVKKTAAIGLDETAFLSHKGNNYHGTRYVTTIADTKHGHIIDIAPSRDKYDVARLLAKQPKHWRDAIQFGTLDLSLIYRAVFKLATPNAQRIADPFHVIKAANERVDALRRRVQWETTGHRGRKNDPLFKIRQRLLTAEEKLSADTIKRIEDALQLGDPKGELILAWRVKESVRDLYKAAGKQEAIERLDAIIDICLRDSSPAELRSLGKTLKEWHEEITAYLENRYSNGPTEGLNNRIKKIKRDGFGFKNFANYRLRVLLVLGGVHINVLKSILIP